MRSRATAFEPGELAPRHEKILAEMVEGGRLLMQRLSASSYHYTLNAHQVAPKDVRALADRALIAGDIRTANTNTIEFTLTEAGRAHLSSKESR